MSKVGLVQLIGSITIALSSDRTPAEWLDKLRTRAAEVAPEVLGIFPSSESPSEAA